MDCSHTHSRWQPQVRVAYDYYPFGLTWHNPEAADTPEGRHDHAYQDKEFQWNEFGAGSFSAEWFISARIKNLPKDGFKWESRNKAWILGGKWIEQTILNFLP